MEKVIRETGETVDDGVHEVYVNAKVKDGTKISDLMDCFTVKELDNPTFPATTRKFRELKNTEGGASAVCEIMERYMKESREEGREEGRAEGALEERINSLKGLIQAGVEKSQLLKVYTEAEYQKALN